MDDLLNKFDIIIKNRSGNKTRLKKQSKNRRYTVNELRTKTNGYLDSLESQLLEKSENMLTVEGKAIANLINVLEKKKKDYNRIEAQLFLIFMNLHPILKYSSVKER